MARIFNRLIFVKMDSMSGCDIRLVSTFPPKDSTLQYKNAYTSEITFLALVPWETVHKNIETVHKYIETVHKYIERIYTNIEIVHKYIETVHKYLETIYKNI